MTKFLFLLGVCMASVAGAVEWRNLDEGHRLGGRKASEGYLQGKVVLVDRWGLKCPPCRAMIPKVEEIWRSFKTKPFVVLGGHCAGWGEAADIKNFLEENEVSYPVYEDAGLAVGEPKFKSIPFLYVVDETGKVVYLGHDERSATQAIVMALTDMESPRDLAQWKRFLDFELEALPGRAFLRAKEFRKKFPKDAQEYSAKFRALAAVPDVKRLSELVEFAKKAKDMREFDAKNALKKEKFAKMVAEAIGKYEPLTESKDLRVVREAKNSLADLKWTQAAL